MTSHVEQIKERLSIVDVVSSYVKLEKAGVNLRAKCPFHNEKTPSFFVSPSRNSYYCFGCGEKGDIFTFVERIEGLDFKGALKLLADRAGVKLAPVNRKDEDRKNRLYRALEESTRFFEDTLALYPETMDYLKNRGLSEKTIREWKIGYAPPKWRELKTYLEERGFLERELLEAGVLKRAEKGGDTYDGFRGRIMFPLMDVSGRVVAYSGRVLPDKRNPEYKNAAAKYINSPETPLYEKRRLLYGYHRAKNFIRKYDFSILVEGQMDVVLSHQAGFANTVASSGTAISEEHLALVSRLSGNLILAFDADAAGLSAGGRGIDLALLRGMDVKVAMLPHDKDPADLVREDVETWRAAVRGARHVIDFYLDHLSATHTDMRKLRLSVGKYVIPYIAKIPNRLDQAHFISSVAARLDIAEHPVWESVRDAAGKQVGEKGAPSAVEVALSNEMDRLETITRRLFGLLLWQEGLKKATQKINVGKLRLRLTRLLGKQEFSERLLKLKGESDILFEVERLYAEGEGLEREVDDLCRELEREHLRREYHEALVQLKRAEKEGADEKVKRALSRCRELSEALHQ